MLVGRKLLTVLAAAALIAALTASTATAAQFEGTVVAKNREAKTFKLRQDEGGGTYKIKVNRSTTFEDIAGFGALSVGDKRIEVVASRRNGRWVASHVERSGKSGGDDDGGGDDNGGKGSDD